MAAARVAVGLEGAHEAAQRLAPASVRGDWAVSSTVGTCWVAAAAPEQAAWVAANWAQALALPEMEVVAAAQALQEVVGPLASQAQAAVQAVNSAIRSPSEAKVSVCCLLRVSLLPPRLCHLLVAEVGLLAKEPLPWPFRLAYLGL